MDAPLYPPAMQYVQPRFIPQPLSTKETPLAEIIENPAAWAIVKKAIPSIEMTVKSGLKMHLGNFALHNLTTFGVVKPEVLVAIDEQFKRLGGGQ